MRKKILTVIGARPQFIKSAVLSNKFKQTDDLEEITVHTGQHFDENMSKIFFDEMNIPKPAYQLSIAGLNHGAMTGRMMEEIEEIVLKEKPDAVLVYGDTNSTLAGALVASKLHIPVIHVEAGLRSFNMEMPEEINRILTDRISKLLLCPTENAIQNLNNEGFKNFNAIISQVGDIMEDSALFYKTVAEKDKSILSKNNLKENEYVIITCHRAENTNDKARFQQIIDGINKIAEEIIVVWPVHPRLRNEISNLHISPNVKMLEPLGYFDMLNLLNNCRLVLTDSGGLQKEAYFFNKYCITMRDQTEWIELVENGFNFLVGANAKNIIDIFSEIKNKSFEKNIELYGGGKSSQKMVEEIRKMFLEIN